MDEAGLVSAHNPLNEGLKPIHHHFGEKFHGAVLQRNRTEAVSSPDALLFWNENEEGPVQSIKVQGAIKKTSKQVMNVRANRWPKLPVEGGTKTIRTGTGAGVHCKERFSDFRVGEGHGEVAGSNIHMWIEFQQIKTSFSTMIPPKQFHVEVVENGAFGSMSTVVVTPL